MTHKDQTVPPPRIPEDLTVVTYTQCNMSLSLTQYPGYYPANQYQSQYPVATMEHHQQQSQSSEVLWANKSSWATSANSSSANTTTAAAYPPQTSSTGSAASSNGAAAYPAADASSSPAISRSSTGSPAESTAYPSMYPHHGMIHHRTNDVIR